MAKTRARNKPEKGEIAPLPPQPPFISETSHGVRLFIHASPGAKRSRCSGRHGDALKVKIAAPPLDGRANAALIDYLAEVLGVPKAQCEIVSGATSRRKEVLIRGVTTAQVLHALACAEHSD